MTVGEALAEGKRLLRSPCATAFIDTPDLDAALLLAEILQAGRTELIVRAHEDIAEQDRAKFLRLVERRRSGECAAYILGRKEFRGLMFSVNPHVLVPRPDTETLVEKALDCIDSIAAQGNISLLDLCTGSGAVAISLKSERPFLSVSASDISAGALETAALNAARLLDEGLSAKGPPVRFMQSDIFNNIPGKFDIIVSNPPYIPSGEIPALAPELRWEPRLALDGGGDGLSLIREIISRSPERLLPGGLLLLEAGLGQIPAIRALLEANRFSGIRVYKDLAGKERVISAIPMIRNYPQKTGRGRAIGGLSDFTYMRPASFLYQL